MSRKIADSVQVPDQEWTAFVRENLLRWYDKNKRELPWRKNKDPYRIWVSEIMLQQTRVDTVIPYYERFMESFPDITALAKAKEEQVLKAWEGLGYYSRVRNLHQAVKEVAATYEAKVPTDPKAVASLRGIGDYTAGAILSIAFDQPVPAVDGNVMRVFSRWFALWDDIVKLSTRRKMGVLGTHLVPSDRPGDFNQALMELGALICTPVNPACGKCPVQATCQAYEQGVQAELPVKKKAKPPRPMRINMAWIRKGGGQVLLQCRPNEGLLAGMWGLPTMEAGQGELVPGDSLVPLLTEQEVPVEWGQVLGEFEHVFSHQRWQVTVVDGFVREDISVLPDGWRWANETERRRLAFPNVYRKAFALAEKRKKGLSGFQGRLL
ncbi:A/G-specific DNA-adenine glycosylase [Marininema mesophilum]|uniref:Adenine DNA glycosylase n=1 Tax=Marininema mesophilum TaxID=1048340 RepID=A0A1H2WFD4_9BACL|nr:A/G-specific adenine glycosylase [Marininema mesophilum]SDW79247.1 A/G-specific DNA-adenine glycosylase [Marininema mesophilum]